MNPTRSVLRALTVMVMTVVGIDSLAAQPRPVGLVHGYNSGPTTWDNLRSALSGYSQWTFPTPPTLASQSGVSIQATQLHSWISGNGFGSNLILVGHSQGGLVARANSRTDSVSGIITIGTPHIGGYIASAKPYLNAWTASFAIASGSVWYLNDVEFYDPLYLAARRALAHVPIVLQNMLLVLSAATIALPVGNGSLTDMTPGSALLSGSNGLNTVPSLEKTGARYAIVGQLNAGYSGGPVRLLPGSSDAFSDQIGYDLYLWSIQLQQDAMDLWDITGFWHVFAVLGLSDMSAMVYNFAPFWTYTIVGGFPNDAVVPTYSQAAFPNANAVPGIVPVAHTEETRQYNAILGRLSLIP